MSGIEILEGPSVRRVRRALVDAGAEDKVRALADTARSARDAANALGCELGAIVKSLVFTVGGTPAMALVAGDRMCAEKELGAILGLAGKVRRCDAELVRTATGFAIGGVSPIGLVGPLPCAIDASLGRFETIWAAAGHPHCVFPTTAAELARLTGGTVSEALARES